MAAEESPLTETLNALDDDLFGDGNLEYSNSRFPSTYPSPAHFDNLLDWRKACSKGRENPLFRIGHYRNFFDPGLRFSLAKPENTVPDVQWMEDDLMEKLRASRAAVNDLGPADKALAQHVSDSYEGIERHMFGSRAAVTYAEFDSILNLVFVPPPPPGQNGQPTLNFVHLAANDEIVSPTTEQGFMEFAARSRSKSSSRARCFAVNLLARNASSVRQVWEDATTADESKPLSIAKLHSHIADMIKFVSDYLTDSPPVNPLDLSTIDALVADIRKQTEAYHPSLVVTSAPPAASVFASSAEFPKVFLAQIIVALSVLTPKGNLLIELPAEVSPASSASPDFLSSHCVLSVLFLLYRHFDHVCLFKPEVSADGSISASKRYLACRKLHQARPPVIECLKSAMRELLHQSIDEKEDFKDATADPEAQNVWELACSDANFVDFIRQANEIFGKHELACTLTALSLLDDHRKGPANPSRRTLLLLNDAKRRQAQTKMLATCRLSPLPTADGQNGSTSSSSSSSSHDASKRQKV